MNCTCGAIYGNSIHGAKREFMVEPIHDNKVVNSLFFNPDLTRVKIVSEYRGMYRKEANIVCKKLKNVYEDYDEYREAWNLIRQGN